MARVPQLLRSDEEELLAETLKRYALDELLPDFSRWRHEPYPRSKVEALGALGVLGMAIPEEFGGSGAPLRSLGVAAEELSRGDINVSYFLQLSAIASGLIGVSGNTDLQRSWLPGVATGELIVAFALTEPGVGSDAAQLSTRAVRDGSDWVITGEKASITFAGQADACVVFARSGGDGARGISMFLVPLDDPAVQRTVYDSAGARLTQRGSLHFDGVRIPASHQLGAEGVGFVSAMQAFDFNRAVIALACIEAAQQSLDETMEHVKQRESFGKPLARHEGVAFQIAEHLAQIHAARLIAYQTLDLADEGRPHTAEAAMCKWLGPKHSAEAIHACGILNGWAGWGHDLPFNQRLNDVMGLEIGDGTPEIMKAVIAREAMGREFTSYK
jgi:cyclohexanecarboxyl-CoA dehydrogenase